MKHWIVAAAAACAAMTAVDAAAQEAPLSRMFGMGIHAYYAGDNAKAHALLTEAIDGGMNDPACFYFRGLAYLRMGRQEQAAADMTRGAAIEASSSVDVRDVSNMLTRVQGRPRVMLERYRADARLVVAKANRATTRDIYEKQVADESAVLRPKERPDGLGVVGDATPIEPMKPEPSADNPFAEGTDPPAVTENTPMETPGAKPPGAEEPAADAPMPADPPASTPPDARPPMDDPFGAAPDASPAPVDPKPADKPPGGNPLDDPFGAPGDDEEKPAEIPPAEVPPAAENPPAEGPAAAADGRPSLSGAIKGILGRMVGQAGDSVRDLGDQLPIPPQLLPETDIPPDEAETQGLPEPGLGDAPEDFGAAEPEFQERGPGEPAKPEMKKDGKGADEKADPFSDDPLDEKTPAEEAPAGEGAAPPDNPFGEDPGDPFGTGK